MLHEKTLVKPVAMGQLPVSQPWGEGEDGSLADGYLTGRRASFGTDPSDEIDQAGSGPERRRACLEKARPLPASWRAPGVPPQSAGRPGA